MQLDLIRDYLLYQSWLKTEEICKHSPFISISLFGAFTTFCTFCIIIIKTSKNMRTLMYYMLYWNLFNVKMFINNSTLRTETIKFNTLPIPMQDSYSVHVIVNEQKLQTLNIFVWKMACLKYILFLQLTTTLSSETRYKTELNPGEFKLNSIKFQNTYIKTMKVSCGIM